jgi:hypothetical protein
VRCQRVKDNRWRLVESRVPPALAVGCQTVGLSHVVRQEREVYRDFWSPCTSVPPYSRVLRSKTRAGLCPWDNRGKANGWRQPPPPSPPPVHNNLQKKKAKLCNIVTATSY